MNNLSQSTYRAGILQSRAYRNLNAFMNAQLKPYQISTPEWAVLGCLREFGTLQPTQIAEQLGVKPPVAAKLIKELSESQLIVATTLDSDKRGRQVELTHKGGQLAHAIERDLRQAMKGWLKDIEPRHLGIYLMVMEQIANLSL